jgi:hypothetical protein
VSIKRSIRNTSAFKKQQKKARLNMSGQQLSMKVNPNDLETLKCGVCAGIHAVQTVILKHMTKLTSPNGIEGIAQIPMGFCCTKCGGINTFTNREQRNVARRDGKDIITVEKEEIKIDPATGLESHPTE